MSIGVGIEITSRCNLACSFCGHHTLTRPRVDMDWDLYTKIVDDIKDNGHRLGQMHYYGEPLVAKDFVKAIKYLADRDMEVIGSFSTNCMLLTPEMTDQLVDNGFVQVHKNCKRIRLCIDSMNEELYKILRVGGNLQEAITNAKYFIEKCQKDLPRMIVQRVLTRLNHWEPLDKFVEVFENKLPIRSQVAGRHQDKDRDLTIIPFEIFGDRRLNCGYLFSKGIWISSIGLITGCPIDADFEQPFADVNNCTIKEAAEIKKRIQQRQEFSARNYDNLPLCDRCTGSECTGCSYVKKAINKWTYKSGIAKAKLEKAEAKAEAKQKITDAELDKVEKDKPCTEI